MFKTFRSRINQFLGSNRDYTVLAGLISGLYPLLFFYSNNFYANNSIPQFIFYVTLVIIVPTLAVYVAYRFAVRSTYLNKYKTRLLFVCVIFITSALMSMAMYMTLKKKILLGILILACITSLKASKYYKHIIVLLAAISFVPLIRVAINGYEHLKGTSWAETDDMMLAVKFVATPNIYMIQPDGYVSEQAMTHAPYSYKNGFYNWLRENKFTVYNNFRSNYPASLTSNASMFAMKQHYFSHMLFPAFEIANAREVIMKNNAVRILKNNNYETFFIAEDEYFQQNRSKSLYDHYNIGLDEIPYFTNGGKVRRDVYEGLTEAMAYKTDQPKFYFVEKVLPHHIHFIAEGNRKETERREYLKKVDEVNGWLRNTINMINEKDPDAIVIILADHGGWVGMESFNEFFSTKNESSIKSTFSNLAAIRWNSVSPAGYDEDLVSNVNVFRVLFAALSQDASHLDYMEEDRSYNVRHDGYFSKNVYQLIDDDGNVTYTKHN